LITKNTIVTIEYNAIDTDGNLVDEGKEALVYLHGGYDDVFAPIEHALEGKSIGDRITVKLQPGQTYGEYDPELVQVVPVDELPQPLKKGVQIEGAVSDAGDPVYSTVTDIADGKAVLDGNHPLAGTALIFHCTVADVRRATVQEIAERRKH
jgi:FKBP-type peptidyl-prolyl cis-trans isomerase SlyD